MMWLARALAAPILWGVLFSVVYGLHGVGCSLGWNERPVLFTDWHHLAMWSAWLLGLGLHLLLLRILPEGEGRRRRLIVMGSWIGLVSSAYTLFPVVVTSSCIPH